MTGIDTTTSEVIDHSVIDRVGYFLLLWVFLGIQIWQHIEAGMTFPTPWPDESHFLWQAVAFAKNFTLYSEELNQSRTIFWMPPGYLILIGLWFKLTGISLGAARMLSLLANLGSFTLLAVAVRRFRLSFLCLLVLGLVFTAPGVVASANVARPETITLFVVCLSLFFMLREKLWVSLGLVLLSPLFHLNGIVFIAGWLVTVGLVHNFRGFGRPARIDKIVLIAVGAVWLAYLIYAIFNWDGFLHDMSYQYHRKAGRDIVGVLMRAENFLLLLLVVAAVYPLLRKRIAAASFIFVAIPSLLIIRMGGEMWYDIYYGAAFVSIAVMLFQSLSLSPDGNLANRIKRAVILITVMFSFYCWGRYDGHLNFKYNPVNQMSWHTMIAADTVPYLTELELATLIGTLDSINSESTIEWVQFIPRGDAFLLPHILDKEYKVSHPLFYDREASVCLFHTSRYIPSWWRFYVEADLKRIGYDSLSQATKLFSRDSTEAWYLIRPVEDTTASSH